MTAAPAWMPTPLPEIPPLRFNCAPNTPELEPRRKSALVRLTVIAPVIVFTPERVSIAFE